MLTSPDACFRPGVLGCPRLGDGAKVGEPISGKGLRVGEVR